MQTDGKTVRDDSHSSGSTRWVEWVLGQLAEWAIANANLLFTLSVASLAVRVMLVPDATFMSSEYYYAKTIQLWSQHQQDIRHITSVAGRGEAGFPNSLFFAIYSIVYRFGDNFYVVAKMLNVFFACLSGLAVARVGGHFIERGPAMLVAALALWMPATSYVAYFMPEALYDSLVWGGLAAFLSALRRDLRIASAWLGVFLGAALLAKPNAAAMLGASNVVVVIIAWRCMAQPERLGRALQSMLALDLAFVATGYLLNVVLTGHAYWDPMGTFYQTGLSQIGTVETNASFVHDIAKYLFAYVFALLFVFGPVAVLMVSHSLRGTRDPAVTALWSFAVVGIGILLLGSVKVGVNWERVYANHVGIYSTRYMSVLFPLLVICFFRFLPQAIDRRRMRRAAGVVLGLAFVALTYAYKTVDSQVQLPEVFGTSYLHPRLFKATAFASLALIAYFAFARRPIARVYGTLLIVYSGLSAVGLVKEDFRRAHDWQLKAYGDAARVVRSTVRPAYWDKGLIVSGTSLPASHFMFVFPGIVPVQLAPKNSALARDAIAGTPEWVVFLDTVRPAFEARCINTNVATLCPLADGALYSAELQNDPASR